MMSAVMKEFHGKEFTLCFRANIGEEIRICVSPETERTMAGGVLRMPLLSKETQRFKLKMERKRKGERIMPTVIRSSRTRNSILIKVFRISFVT